METLIDKAMKEGIKISFEGATIYNNGGTINGDIVNPTYFSSSNTQDGLPRMPHFLNRKQATQLCQMLIKGGFLAKSNNIENFCSVMGCIDVDVEKMQPIIWTANVQLLRELLEFIYSSLLADKALTKADIERRVPMCFVDEKKKNITLAKNKYRPEDPQSNRLLNILTTLFTQDNNI